MNKFHLFAMAVTGSLALCACSDNQGAESGLTEANQVISLAVLNGNHVTTRAGRPLYSSEANQTIENVVVYIVNSADKEIKQTKKFSSWQSESSEHNTDDGRYAEFLLETKLEDGNYQIFAVGYHNDSSYEDIENALKSGSTFNENAVLKLSTDGGAEEIFAGSTEPFEVRKSEGFKKPIVLNRQVAGVYVYVKEIPYIASATELRLVAAAENNRLVLGQFDNRDLDNNGAGNSISSAVVNGFSEEAAFDKTLLRIDLNDWFSSIEASGTLIDASKWQKPAEYEGKATFEKGAVFGGAFVIPFAKVDRTQTLTLQLTTAGGEVKRSWNVNRPTGDMDPYTLYTWDTFSSTFASQESVSEDKNFYNIVRNHIYGLGTRTSNDPGSGTDTEPGSEEQDAPVSLNNKHEIKLVVNDNWEVIHDMELD